MIWQSLGWMKKHKHNITADDGISSKFAYLMASDWNILLADTKIVCTVNSFLLMK